ncbi:hypothetical protein ACCO45_011806 [Purpureocillium lilacinum]|uniref:Uncharacterized protein n=1 Tax=Purpureocillium lilacinum TaxID=33203 RepID=A0ACC4DBX0_PURLI
MQPQQPGYPTPGRPPRSKFATCPPHRRRRRRVSETHARTASLPFDASSHLVSSFRPRLADEPETPLSAAPAYKVRPLSCAIVNSPPATPQTRDGDNVMTHLRRNLELARPLASSRLAPLTPRRRQKRPSCPREASAIARGQIRSTIARHRVCAIAPPPGPQ